MANVAVLARYGIMHRFKRYHQSSSDISKRTNQGRSTDPIFTRLEPGPIELNRRSPAVSPGQWNTGPLFKRRPTFRRVQIDPDLIDKIKRIDKKSDLGEMYRQSLI